ncbi:MAG: tyrosine-protein phosphatase [Oscillospiraceae bacterium]|nr:tyrosine-protein phosphatase [Oscillospiraceae bacterium]
MQYRRLPLEGLKNARDLGGYPSQSGGVTRFGQFIRCEAPRALTSGDIEIIKSCGVTDSIDFRGDNEVAAHPNSLASADGFIYHRCPTFDKQLAFAAANHPLKGRPAMDAFVDWGEKYIELASNAKAWVKTTLGIMAKARGGVIFNCTTGKDRTGVISALLLGIADAAEADIIADYCVSELYLTEVYREILEEYLKRWPGETANLSSPFFRTAPENMGTLLEHIKTAYGGVMGYLESCGLMADELSRLREKLVAG